MRELDAALTLAVWEIAGAVSPARRPAAVLAAAGAGPPDELARLPLGRRDALLLLFHATAFGDRVEGVADCAACGTTVELTASCATLLTGAPEAVAEFLPLETDGWTVHWRPPDTDDTVAAGAHPDGAAVLLDRCVLDAKSPDGAGCAGSALPAPVRDALADAIGRADPLAEMVLELTCPQCAAQWEAPLEIAAFVWARLRAASARLLRDVDTLARAYGWPEAAILALPPGRRGAYLDLVAGDG